MKPSLEDVLKFVEEKLKKHIAKYAWNLPPEQQDEARQEAYVRVLEAYERLESGNTAWKGYIDLNARGGVIDYIKLGEGFIEDKKGKETRANLVHRAFGLDDDGNERDVELILGHNGVFSDIDDNGNEVNWALVAKMSAVDSTIHLIAKLILGFSLEELEKFFKTPKEALSRRYKRFLKRLDMPYYYALDPWLNQFIYAFGLSEHFHVKTEDNGLGHDAEPVDLYSKKPLRSSIERDGLAIYWISELIDNDLKAFESRVRWKLVAKMAAIDEEICLIACILKGFQQSKLCEIFEDTSENLKARAKRFIKRLDSPDLYNDLWVNQIIYAFGLAEHFKQTDLDFGVGHFVEPIDFNSFSNYQKASSGNNQLSILAGLSC